MQIRYICGHTTDFTIHKDGLEAVNVRHKCNDCRRLVLPKFITRTVGVHILVIKLAQREE